MIDSQTQTIIIAVGSAIAAAIATVIVTYIFARKDSKSKDKTDLLNLRSSLRNAQSELKTLNQTIEHLTGELSINKENVSILEKISEKYESVKSRLKNSKVVREYYLPVILIGPRDVGKTSLLWQLHTPWKTTAPDPTTNSHRHCNLPIYDFTKENNEPHFADPDVPVEVDIHLGLRIFDFPGELNMQQKIREIILEETESLRKTLNKNLGIVLIFMFDSEEVVTGVKLQTNSYYNGELFKELKSLVSHNMIDIDKIIVIFNKYDKLKIRKPNISDQDLLELCAKTYSEIFKNLKGICNPEKVCEITTIFDRENMHLNNKGATIVTGEASRKFVSSFIGSVKTEEIFPEGHPTNFLSKYF